MSKFRPNNRFSLSQEEERNWANAIGGVFLNFGAIELTSLRWVEYLTNSHLERDQAARKKLAQRIAQINKLVDRTKWLNIHKASAIQFWNEVATKSTIRNRIAHNPFVSGADVQGSPLNGIIDVRDMTGPGPHRVELLRLEEIVETALRAGELAHALQLLLEYATDKKLES